MFAIAGKTTAGALGGIAALTALAGLPVAAAAQETRPGWAPFLGCWQTESGDEAEGVLCLVASGEDVDMLTIVDGSVAFREPFAADGLTREIERDGCEGTEAARFSDDRLRLYTASDVACDGEAPRRSTGIISMIGPARWLDVRAIEVNGAATVWSRDYRRTDSGVLVELGLVERAGRGNPFALRGMAFAQPRVTVDHVIDASRNVGGEAVKGWLAEVGREFAGLDAGDLIRLDDAGVPGAVIDVVVAVSFPEHFALNAEDDAHRRDRRYGYRGIPFYYGSYYGGWGYGRYGYYGRYRGYYTPVVVTVDRTRGSAGGRIVAGKGYRGPRDKGSSGSGGRRKVRDDGSKSGSSSSGSSRRSTGRKAKPRGGK